MMSLLQKQIFFPYEYVEQNSMLEVFMIVSTICTLVTLVHTLGAVPIAEWSMVLHIECYLSISKVKILGKL